MREGWLENSDWLGPEVPRSQEALANRGDFWYGEDVTVKRTVIEASRALPIAKEVRLKISKKNLPDIKELSLATIHLLRTSTRSCYAQVGLDIQPEIDKLTEGDIQKIVNGKEIDCPATAMNYSRRAIELNGGLFRFFWLNAENHLIGDELVDAVKKMKIDGEEGKDWFFGKVGEGGVADEDDTIGNDTPLTLRLRIKDSKLWVPFSSEMEPVKIQSKEDLNKYLREVPDGLVPDFMICETVPVCVPDNLVGVVNIGAYDGGGRHSNSSLIDPKFNGPIRLEIVRPMAHPDFVELMLYRHEAKRKADGV